MDNNPVGATKPDVIVTDKSLPDNSVSNHDNFLFDLLRWLSVIWVLVAPVIFIHRNYGISSFIDVLLNNIGFSNILSEGIARALTMVAGRETPLDYFKQTNGITFAFPEQLIWHSIIYTVISLAILWGLGLVVYGMWSWFRCLLVKHNIQESKCISIISNLANKPAVIAVIVLLFLYCLYNDGSDKYVKYNRYEIVGSGNIAYKIDRQSGEVMVLIGKKQIPLEASQISFEQQLDEALKSQNPQK